METLDQWIARHRQQAPNDGLRLGQRFCNEFISAPMPRLYYETDDEIAIELIRTFLTDLHYFPHTPGHQEKGFR
jgi:hypothetical protein